MVLPILTMIPIYLKIGNEILQEVVVGYEALRQIIGHNQAGLDAAAKAEAFARTEANYQQGLRELDR